MAIGAAFWVFELYEAKVSRTVLWGEKPCEGLTYPAQPTAKSPHTKAQRGGTSAAQPSDCEKSL